MTRASDFTEIAEAAARKVKKFVVRDGRRILVVKNEYVVPCRDGYKRDPETGQCVKMSLREQRNRSIAATRAANKASTKRNKFISMSRRKSLIKD